MPSSGAFSVLRLRAPRLHRDESSVTTKNSKLHESIRIQAFVHRLELRLQTRGLRAHLAPELNLHVLRVPSTCFSLLRRIISLLRRNYLPVIVLFRVHRQTLPNLLLFKLIFLQKPVLRPPILPVFRLLSGSIRENEGAKPPLDDPAEFASPQARMEPRRLEMCECGSLAGGQGRGVAPCFPAVCPEKPNRKARRDPNPTRLHKGRGRWCPFAVPNHHPDFGITGADGPRGSAPVAGAGAANRRANDSTRSRRKPRTPIRRTSLPCTALEPTRPK